MNNLEERVNNYINNELLNFNNIDTNPLEGKDLKDSILKIFNTNNLLVSTFSIIASIIATYLTARRSEYGFVGFIINDIILITLWSIPVIGGDTNLIPVLLCPVLLLINDIYGVYNWKKIKNKQKEDLK